MQIVAQAQVAELARLRVLVQAAVLELAQMQAQRLVQEPELELVLAQGWEPARQQELTAVPESPQSQELAAVLERVRELRVSRQQKQQQHRLLAAAQELLPCRPALPMKAPC